MLFSRIGEFYLFQPLAKVTQLYAVRIDRKKGGVENTWEWTNSRLKRSSQSFLGLSVLEWPRTNQKLIEEVG